MQALLISCFIVIVCGMGAWVALSGSATRSQILKRGRAPQSSDLD